MISDRDVAFYHEHGYLVVPGVLERSSIETPRYFGVAQEPADAART